MLITPALLFSQEWGIKFSGFVKSDIMLDTRQNETFREGHFLLFPKDIKEIDGGDVNEGLNFNILSIQQELQAKLLLPIFSERKLQAFSKVHFSVIPSRI